MRIAVFGGSFNPVHNGHIELAKAVHELAGYDKVLFVPAYHSPFKDMPTGATDDDRVRMLELALVGFPWASIEDCELIRGGMSYTYDLFGIDIIKCIPEVGSSVGFDAGLRHVERHIAEFNHRLRCHRRRCGSSHMHINQNIEGHRTPIIDFQSQCAFSDTGDGAGQIERL